MSRPRLAVPRPHPRTDDAPDVVAPGRRPSPPKADPWRHDSPAEPRGGVPQPATVQGQHHTGLLRVRWAGDDGAAGEYHLDVDQALRLAQRLRDAAAAMREFLG